MDCAPSCQSGPRSALIAPLAQGGKKRAMLDPTAHSFTPSASNLEPEARPTKHKIQTRATDTEDSAQRTPPRQLRPGSQRSASRSRRQQQDRLRKIAPLPVVYLPPIPPRSPVPSEYSYRAFSYERGEVWLGSDPSLAAELTDPNRPHKPTTEATTIKVYDASERAGRSDLIPPVNRTGLKQRRLTIALPPIPEHQELDLASKSPPLLATHAEPTGFVLPQPYMTNSSAWTRDAILWTHSHKLCWRQFAHSMHPKSGSLIGGPLELAWVDRRSNSQTPAANLPLCIASLARERFRTLYAGHIPPIFHHLEPVYHPLYKYNIPTGAIGSDGVLPSMWLF